MTWPQGASASTRSARSAAARATSASSWKPASLASTARWKRTAVRAASPPSRSMPANDAGLDVAELGVELGQRRLGGVVVGDVRRTARDRRPAPAAPRHRAPGW